MSTLESLFAKPVSNLESKEQVERIRLWIRAHLPLEIDTVISVHQIECRATACPGIETVVAVIEYRRTRRIKILKPLAEVQESDLAEAIVDGKISTQTYPLLKD